MAGLCRMVGCNSLGTKKCGACGAVHQKADWKVHKLSCVNVDKLPTTFVPQPQIHKYLEKMTAKILLLKTEKIYRKEVDLLRKYLVFLKIQYGVQVEGTRFCKRSNDEIIDSSMLASIQVMISMAYFALDAFDSSLAARQVFEHRDKSTDADFDHLFQTEQLLTRIYSKKKCDKAEHHGEQCLMFARLIKGESRIAIEQEAMVRVQQAEMRSSRRPEATDIFEKAYILVSQEYGPVHSKVQDAAKMLINQLITDGDYSRADDYCRINHENLTDRRNGIDRDDDQVAEAMLQIASIWLLKACEDMKAAAASADEAEDMMRKACQIVEKRDGRNSRSFYHYAHTLDNLLSVRVAMRENSSTVRVNMRHHKR